jgi:Protein of unknown function (DUF4231)
LRIWRSNGETSDPWAAPDPALALALQQTDWYAHHRDLSRTVYRVSEFLILLVTALTTVAAALKASAWLTASLAASAVVLTGLHKVFDSHDRWVAFGSAWAVLQVAVNDYRLLPEDQRDADAQRRLLAKVNEVITADTGAWATRRHSMAGQRSP